MTNIQCLKKCKELIRNAKIMEECERLIKSGGINVSEANKDEFTVPRVIVSTALLNVADKIGLNDKMIRDRHSLLKF